MIIQSSEVYTSVKHEKTESTTVSYSKEQQSTKNSDALDPLAKFKLILANYDKTKASSETAKNTEQNSILSLTKDGFKFKTGDSESSLSQAQIYTSELLFKRLLQAISAILNKDKTQAQQDAAPIDLVNTNIIEKNKQTNESQLQLTYPAGFNIEISLKTTTHIQEHESLDFNSSGKITTLDGRDFVFDLSISKRRDFSYTATTEFTQKVEFKDPLIINYPGNSAELSSEKYAFDIDADGNQEMISYFTNASMLAIDKNNDSVINDGSELFGTATGNGFADLALYDENGDNFIDETDSVFNQLKLWNKTAEIDTLSPLSAMDIGAIYLGASATSFDIKDQANQLHGQLKASSFYLTQAGSVGSVQQVDMAV